jgi:ribosomal protein L7Ae-like RNA K-turn-binding protein
MPKVKRVPKSNKVAPAPYAPKKEASSSAPVKAEKKKNPLFEKRSRNFGIGGDLHPGRDVTRFVKWPKYIKLQRQRRVLYARLKIPPAINQFSRTLDKNTALELFKLLKKYRPESKAAKKARLLNRANYLVKAEQARKEAKKKAKAEQDAKKKEDKQKKMTDDKPKRTKEEKKAAKAAKKAGKDAKKTAKDAEQKAAKEAKPAKDASAQEAKPAKDAKAGKEAKPAKDAKAGKEAKPAKAGKAGKAAKPAKGAAAKDPKEKKPKFLKYGINHITALIEQKKAQLVVIANDVDPVELVVWLPALCRKMQVPYCIVKNKARLGALVRKKTATAVAVTKVNKEHQAAFNTLTAAIKANYNDRFDEFRKQWGGGRLGAKSSAALLKRKRKAKATLKAKTRPHKK